MRLQNSTLAGAHTPLDSCLKTHVTREAYNLHCSEHTNTVRSAQFFSDQGAIAGIAVGAKMAILVAAVVLGVLVILHRYGKLQWLFNKQDKSNYVI